MKNIGAILTDISISNTRQKIYTKIFTFNTIFEILSIFRK